MSGFTYESEETTRQLETFEWDNIWWEHTENTAAPRALIVGDSISCGYRHVLNQKLAGDILADGFGTSKAVDNPFFMKSLHLFIEQMSRLDAIVFNSGLHGWHLSTPAYRAAYRQIIGELTARFGDKKFAIALTTPVRNAANLAEFEDRNAVVIERNQAAREIAAEYGLPMLDYYTPLSDKPELFSGDGVHLTDKGYDLLAELCAAYIKK